MDATRLLFEAIDEARPGPKWRAHFDRTWPDYSAWFLREGDAARPGYLSCLTALERHMPELVPLWQTLVGMVGGGDRVARMLSLYRPTPYLAGCSQAIWTRPGEPPALVRNYDYHPARCEGMLLRSRWHGTEVIAMSDCLWGALDGVNEHGLALSLAFGGRRAIGEGFGIPLVIRYVLEFCRDIDDALAAFERVPSHMSYTVAAVDKSGRSATIHLNPDRPTQVVDTAVSTNHQHEPHIAPDWPEHAELTATLDREAFLLRCLAAPNETVESFARRFERAPIAARDYSRAFGTLYTAIYWPARGEAEYRWQGRTWHQSFRRFVEGTAEIVYLGGDEPDEPGA